MIALDPCPRCGSNLAPGSPGGLCARCLLGDILEPISAAPTSGGILETLALTAGPLPRVLLRDTEAFNGPGPMIRPGSDEMPTLAARSGRLQLFGEIARGGMGAVLKGRDNDLGRDLAVKVLLEKHGDDPGLTRRFVEEAQIAGQLQHPGIVPVYELGAFADQRPYFTMKLVKGRTLAEVMADRDRPSDDHPRLLAIFLDVAQTMAYAHARGVIHRDLKPSNVMVGSFGEVQVMDWGLAKVLLRGGAVDDREAGKGDVHETVIATARSGGSGSDLDLSHAGSVLGTPSYMAPEQARGENDHLDERADVFALGSILCEMLTGQSAFSGRTTGEILRKAARGDVADALARLDASGADDRLALAEAVVDRLSRHNAGVQQRLRDAEIAQAAESARAEEALHTAEAAEARARAEGHARRLTVALAASVLGLAALGGGGYAWDRGQKADRSARLVRSVDDALAEAARLRGEARSAPPGASAPWVEALAAARRADELSRQGDANEATRSRVAEALKVIAAERDRIEVDRSLLARLEAVQGARADDADVKRADASYSDAFRRAGLDLDLVDPVEAGRWIAGRSDPVEMLAHLDTWASHRRWNKAPEPAWRRLVDAAIAADRDAWRNEVRRLIAVPAGDRLRALRRLADDVEAQRRQPAASLVLLALLLRQDRADVDSAATVLRRAVFDHPGDYWARCHLAWVFSTRPNTSEGGMPQEIFPDPVESIRQLTAAVAIRPEAGVARVYLAFALWARGKRDEAAVEYREVIRLRPRYSAASTEFAYLLRELGRVDEALAVCREAARANPDNAAVHVCLSRLLLARGQKDLAEVETREAIRLDDKSSEIRANSGAFLFIARRFEESIAACREAIRLDPTNAEAHSNLGAALNNLGRLDEAVAAYREAIRLYPTNAVAHSNLGGALNKLGRPDEGLAACREAIRLDPTNAGAHANLGGTLFDLGRPDECLAACREAIRLDPTDAGAHVNLGGRLNKLGRPDECLAAYREAIRLDPTNAVAHANLGGVLNKLGRPDEGLAACREAIRLDPTNAGAHTNLGGTLFDLGRFDECLAAGREAIRLYPTNVAAHANLGFALIRLGRLDEAVAAYREAIRLDPTNAGAHGNLGAALTGLVRFDEGLAACREAIRLDPTNAAAHGNLGAALIGLGRPDEGLAACREAIRLDPTNAVAHANLGAALIGLGRPDEAVAAYREAIRLDPEKALSHERLAKIFESRGEYAEAIAEYRIAEASRARRPDAAHPGGAIGRAERLAALLARLDAVLGGSDRPRDAAEAFEFADLCHRRKRDADAARLAAEALAADPKLAADPRLARRYNPACYAILAASAKSEGGTPGPDADVRAGLRRRALGWLRADLDAWSVASARKPEDVALRRQTLAYWNVDPDLLGVRDPKALADLPEAERADWQALWARVDALIGRPAEGPPKP